MGSLFQKNGSFHYRCYSSVDIETGKPLAAVGENGKVLKKQQSIILVRQDEDLYRSHKSSAVILLANAKAEEIKQWELDVANNETKRPDFRMTVTEFYDSHFLPWLISLVATGQRSHATLVTYKRLWDTYLSEHFNGTKTFKNYQPYVGQQFLDELRKEDGTPLGANTLKHIHSAASGIFARAIRVLKGLSENDDVRILNPWNSIKVADVASISAEQGPAAAEKDIEIIISNVEAARGGRDDWNLQLAQVALAVGIYAGLRPSEISGLRWSAINLDEVKMTICRAHVYGKTKEKTKTKKNRTVHYDDKLTGILRVWWGNNGRPTDGWVFPNRDGNPVNMTSMIDRHIRPYLNGAEWHDFYALRRGAITDRINNRKWSTAATAEFAGNTEAVIEKHYRDKQDGKLSNDAREQDRAAVRRNIRLEIQSQIRDKKVLALAAGEGQ
jgi:integrase